MATEDLPPPRPGHRPECFDVPGPLNLTCYCAEGMRRLGYRPHVCHCSAAENEQFERLRRWDCTYCGLLHEPKGACVDDTADEIPSDLDTMVDRFVTG